MHALSKHPLNKGITVETKLLVYREKILLQSFIHFIVYHKWLIGKCVYISFFFSIWWLCMDGMIVCVFVPSIKPKRKCVFHCLLHPSFIGMHTCFITCLKTCLVYLVINLSAFAFGLCRSGIDLNSIKLNCIAWWLVGWLVAGRWLSDCLADCFHCISMFDGICQKTLVYVLLVDTLIYMCNSIPMVFTKWFVISLIMENHFIN